MSTCTGICEYEYKYVLHTKLTASFIMQNSFIKRLFSHFSTTSTHWYAFTMTALPWKVDFSGTSHLYSSDKLPNIHWSSQHLPLPFCLLNLTKLNYWKCSQLYGLHWYPLYPLHFTLNISVQLSFHSSIVIILIRPSEGKPL